MRYQGKIASWNSQRGFGFIKPQSQPQSGTQGEQRDADLFVHLSSLTFDGKTPEAGERVSYQLGTGKDGKSCALQVFFPDRPCHWRMDSVRRLSGPRPGAMNPAVCHPPPPPW